MFEIHFDFGDFTRRAEAIGKTGKNVNFAVSWALNQALKDGRKAEQDTMRAVFERPKPYTINALQVRPAKKADPLRGALEFKEGHAGTPAWKYLGPHVDGGARRHKGFERQLQRVGILQAHEFAVPSKRMPVDAYGNVRGGEFTRILSALGAQTDRWQNTTAKSRARKPRRNMDYFVMRGHNKAPDGIYLRKPKWSVPMLLFVKAPTYKKRFPYYEVARRTIPTAFHRHFLTAWDKFIVNDKGRKR